MAEHRIAEAAALLGVSVDTVRRRVKAGQLPARRAGDGSLLVNLPDHDAGGDREPSPTSQASSSSGDLERLQADLDHTRALLAEVERSRDALQAMVETLTRQLDAAQQAQQKDAEERRELRLLLANAQAQLGWLLPAPSSDAQQDVVEASSSRRWRWPWARA